MIKIKTENGSIGLGSQYIALKGEPGESGVYIGTTAPEDENINVWINPEGEASTGLLTREELESYQYATAAEVIELIDAALGEIGVAEEEEF